MGEGRSTLAVGVKVLAVWVSLALFTICLTLLFLGMRAVLDIGGSCASGGPYEVARSCPQGVGWMVPVSIWIGLLALAGYTMAGRGLPGPKFIGLAWPALFLSLGWNFLEYGIDPPDQDGVAISLLVCAVLFVGMGAVPLVVLLADPAGRRWMLWSDATPATGRQTYRDTKAAATGFDWRQLGVVDVPASVSDEDRDDDAQDRGRSQAGVSESILSGGDDDMIERLERLSALHRRGDLTAAEFSDAKALLLEGRR